MADQEASVNRFRTRTSAATAGLAVGALAAAMALSGCSAGQVSQMATQAPAVNGTAATIGSIELRNVHIRAVQDTDYIRPGSDVELLFVAANNSSADGDRLVSITSEVGTVQLSGDTEIKPGLALVVGTPDLQPSPLDATEGDETAEAQVTITEDITNGLTYPFTFTFEKAGEQTVLVPISAGEAPRRDGDVEYEHSGEHAEGGGGESAGGGH
jgi:copper(I)-binding protein